MFSAMLSILAVSCSGVALCLIVICVVVACIRRWVYKLITYFNIFYNILVNRNFIVTIIIIVIIIIIIINTIYQDIYLLYNFVVTQKKQLKTSPHRVHDRYFISMCWKDSVRNKEVREKTALQKLKFIIKKWEDWRDSGASWEWMTIQVTYLEANTTKIRQTKPRKNCSDIII